MAYEFREVVRNPRRILLIKEKAERQVKPKQTDAATDAKLAHHTSHRVRKPASLVRAHAFPALRLILTRSSSEIARARVSVQSSSVLSASRLGREGFKPFVSSRCATLCAIRVSSCWTKESRRLSMFPRLRRSSLHRLDWLRVEVKDPVTVFPIAVHRDDHTGPSGRVGLV